jgi:hypothetical protein
MTGVANPIASALGVTEAGLKVLFRLKRRDLISGNNAGVKLVAQGYATQINNKGARDITPEGLVLCERARKMGW